VDQEKVEGLGFLFWVWFFSPSRNICNNKVPVRQPFPNTHIAQNAASYFKRHTLLTILLQMILCFENFAAVKKKKKKSHDVLMTKLGGSYE